MVASLPPSVIVIAPPWLRSGAGRVIEAQHAYYRQRGFRVAFIAVPYYGTHMLGHPLWDRHEVAVGDLRADWTATAPVHRNSNPRTAFRRAAQVLCGRTAIDWIVQIGASGEPSRDIAGFTGDRPPELIHANYVYTLGFAHRLRRYLPRGHPKIPIVVETHDVQSHNLHDVGVPNPWTRKPDRLERLVRAEIALLSQAKVLVHLSIDDLAFFTAQLPDRPHILAMPSIDPDFVRASASDMDARQAEAIDLLFVGSAHVPNVEALGWFFREVWPLIADRGFKLKIVGNVDHLMRGQLPHIYSRFRAHFVGAVADLAAYYRAARCVIAPMVSGHGISIKTIEALALGIPFVGTAKAFRGMPMDLVREAGLQTFDQPEAFASAIVDAVGGHPGMRGRALYDRLFSREAYFNSLDKVHRLAVGADLKPSNGRLISMPR